MIAITPASVAGACVAFVVTESIIAAFKRDKSSFKARLVGGAFGIFDIIFLSWLMTKL